MYLLLIITISFPPKIQLPKSLTLLFPLPVRLLLALGRTVTRIAPPRLKWCLALLTKSHDDQLTENVTHFGLIHVSTSFCG